MIEMKSLEAVRERERELQFRKESSLIWQSIENKIEKIEKGEGAFIHNVYKKTETI